MRLREMWGVSLTEGQVNSRAKRFVPGSGSRRKLCTVPYHISFTYETCRNKEVRREGRFYSLNISGGDQFLLDETDPSRHVYSVTGEYLARWLCQASYSLTFRAKLIQGGR